MTLEETFIDLLSKVDGSYTINILRLGDFSITPVVSTRLRDDGTYSLVCTLAVNHNPQEIKVQEEKNDVVITEAV